MERTSELRSRRRVNAHTLDTDAATTPKGDALAYLAPKRPRRQYGMSLSGLPRNRREITRPERPPE